jgi:hypothetical protein
MIRLSERNKFVASQSLFRIFILLIFSTLLFLASCSKPAGVIGVGIQPDDSKLTLGYNDTATVYAYSSPSDSVRSDYLSWNGIGSLYDPFFGHTNVGFYTQFILSSVNQFFGKERVLDSLILQLAYSGVFADTNKAVTAHVYEMAEGLETETAYYSNLQLQIYPGDYGNISFLPDPFDTTIIGDDTLPGILRLNLSNNNLALAEKLLGADTTDMTDTDVFQEFFKGLFVTASPAEFSGSIAQFNLTSPLSRLILYYRNESDTFKVQKNFDYYITSSTARVSKYEHVFNTGDQDFRQQVVSGDTLLGADKFYLKGLGGVNATIKIPNMAEWRALGNIAINEAKLELNGFEVDPLWGAPPQLELYNINEDGSIAFLDDYYEGENYFGGDYNASSNNYTFRITRYIQSLINDSTIKNNGLSLRISTPWIIPNRFIFNGHESDSTGIMLKILYTELD